MNFRLYRELFFTFIKIGGFTIGGGYAMIPIISHEVVDVKKWVTDEEMLDILALSQSLPGVIAINAATAVGGKKGGLLGAIVATCGMVLPSLVSIILVALAFDAFQKMELVQQAFQGVRAAVVALIAVAVLRLLKSAVTSSFQAILLVATFLSIVFFRLPPQYAILFAAIFGLLHQSFFVAKRLEGKK